MYLFSDFECVLTNIQMERLDKNLFRLPKEEALRTEGILKKAISLENGVNDLESDHNETPVGKLILFFCVCPSEYPTCFVIL